MRRVAAFTLSLWSAAALLYFDAHSVAGMGLCGVIVLAGLDLCSPRGEHDDGAPHVGSVDSVDRR